MAGPNLPTRFHWPPNFPNVVSHCEEQVRERHPAYLSAKSGDALDAISLANDLVNDDALDRLKKVIAGRSAIILPVTADEISGFNAIPDAVAQKIAAELNLEARP